MLVKNLKIVSYKKKRNNIYEIALSNNEKISLYDDVILKYELLLKKEINDNELKDILFFNSKIESYNIALKFLNTKLRTEKEIKKKLISYDKEVINYAIERLKNEGYINDNLYIKSYVNDEINLKMSGPNKIIFDLKKLGFNEINILDYINTFEEDIWLSKINKYVIKKINSNHNLSGFMLKQKLYNELINKGFYKEHINLIINDFEFNDDFNIKEKECSKLKNKLSKKFSGEELEYRIKIGLIKKGFK